MDRRPLDLPGPAAAATDLRCLGEVAWYSPDRGFGFVHPDDGGDEVFLTWQSLPGTGFRSVRGGQRVAYARGADAHGPVALDVELLGD